MPQVDQLRERAGSASQITDQMRSEPGLDRDLNDSAMLNLLNEDLENLKDGEKPGDRSISSINISTLETQGYTKDNKNLVDASGANDQSMLLID